MIQRSAGGVAPAKSIIEKPVETLMSGPAGGVMGGLYIAQNTDYKNLILGDVGGTSFDVSLISNGESEVITEAQVESMPIIIPMIDIRSIGAGGGSIAWIDEANALHVGPQSAGADPGPVCYNRGGLEPTVTDAAVCLNIINPENFIGGKMHLAVEKAKESLQKNISGPLKLTLEQTANGILQIMTNHMSDLVREILIEKGEDPRSYSLLMFGGAGPLFASSIIDQLDISRTIIPKEPANFSAYGMMMTDVIHDYKQTFVKLVQECKLSELKTLFSNMERMGMNSLERENVPTDARKILRSIDVRYLGQIHELNVPVASLSSSASKNSVQEEIVKNFNKKHETIYGYKLDNHPVQIVRLNVRVMGVLQKPGIPTLKETKKGSLEEALKTVRKIHLPDGPVECPIYDRSRLRNGYIIEGPAVVEEKNSTTFLTRNNLLTVDGYGQLIIERKK
jgi:N-methylhydantoinase A